MIIDAPKVLTITLALSSLLSACDIRMTQGAQDEDFQDPYREFSQAVAEVEPLINPQLDALLNTVQAQTDNQNNQTLSISLPKINPLMIDGNATIVTEASLRTFHQRMYQRLVNLGYTGVIDFKSMTVSRAIEEFCDRKTGQILTLKRRLSTEELSRCQRQGRAAIALPLAKDALLVVMNQQDRFVSGINPDKLRAILTQKQWSEIEPQWPPNDISRKLIGPDSTTVDLLSQQLFQGRSKLILTAPTTHFFTDLESLIQSVSVTPNSVSFLSHSAYQQLSQRFRVVPINGISASPDTIQNEVYPLHQTVYLYIDQTQLASAKVGGGPTLSYALSNLYLTYTRPVISEVSLLSLGRSQLNQSFQQWLKLTAEETASRRNPSSAEF